MSQVPLTREPQLDRQPDFVRIRSLSHLLDNAIPIPGTRLRVGLDALLGLVPGVGDLIGVAFSVYIMAVAKRLGATNNTLLRMSVNVLVEAVIGLIPVVGDLFDFAWKANARNIELLESMERHPEARARADGRFALFLGLLFLLIFSALLTGLIGLVRLAMQAFG